LISLLSGIWSCKTPRDGDQLEGSSLLAISLPVYYVFQAWMFWPPELVACWSRKSMQRGLVAIHSQALRVWPCGVGVFWVLGYIPLSRSHRPGP
jgi:hypothetical protein